MDTPAAPSPTIAAVPRNNLATAELVALLVLTVSGISGGTLGPIVLNLSVRELGLSDAQGGFILAAEAAGYGVGNLLFALAAYRLPRKALAWLALSIVIVGNLVAATATSAETLLVLRGLCGVGMGLVGGVVFAIAAADSAPQRLYALMSAAFLGGAVLVLMLGSLLADAWGIIGLFGYIALLAGAGAIATVWLPEGAWQPRPSTAVSRNSTAGRFRDVVPLLLGLLALNAGHNALWSYQARIGVAQGLPDVTVGYLLGLSAIGGIVGALTAFKLRLSLGYARSQALTFAVLVVSALTLVYGTGLLTYVIGVSVLKIAWFFGLPYVQGAIARFDPQGRLIAVGSTMQTLGAAVGPASAALVVDRGLVAVGWIGMTFYVICAVLVFPVFIRIDRESAPQHLASTPGQSKRAVRW